jgi:integrase
MNVVYNAACVCWVDRVESAAHEDHDRGGKRVGNRRPILLFGDGAVHMRLPNSANGWFMSAIGRVQAEYKDFPRVTPHDLRHTAASLAVSAGANVKAVQRMLGHASAAMTLDVYSDLFDDDLDGVAEALDHAAQDSSVITVLSRSDSGNEKSP